MRVDIKHTRGRSERVIDRPRGRIHARAQLKIESGRQLKVLVVQISNFQLNPPLNN